MKRYTEIRQVCERCNRTGDDPEFDGEECSGCGGGGTLHCGTWQAIAREHGWSPPLAWVDGPPTRSGTYATQDRYGALDVRRISQDAINRGWWAHVVRHVRISLPDPSEVKP